MGEFNLDDFKLKKKEKRGRMQATISKDLLDRFDSFADKYGFDRSKLLEKAIENLLDKIEKNS